MKIRRYSVLLSILLVGSASAADLDISLTGLRHARGIVMVAVYTAGETYMKTAVAESLVAIDATTLTASVHIKDVPSGGIAVTVYHDENGNGKLDTNMLGIPREPVGFSNGARPRFGPPGFEKASVAITEGANAIEVLVGGAR